MPTTVLLFSIDMIPEHGCATSGGGLRAWSVKRGLEEAGCEVLCSVPHESINYLAQKAWERLPSSVQELAWDWQNQEEIIRQAAPDVIVYSSNLAHVAIRAKPRCPIVIDMHGPIMLEHWYVHRRASEEEFNNWLRMLALADCYATVTEKQRRFFSSWLLSAGVSAPKDSVHVVPVSLSPELPTRTATVPAEPVFVFGGGFFPWTDPSSGLLGLVEVLDRQKFGRLWAFTDFHNLEQSRSQFLEVRDRLQKSDRVWFPGFLSRDELLARYAQATVALDVMKRNPERELALTTRTIEYLWCGLPVIYNDYAELAGYIRRYRAGWCVNPDDRDAIRRTVEWILANPDKLPEYSQNAQRLVRENFTWDRTIKPLADYCRAAPSSRDLRAA